MINDTIDTSKHFDVKYWRDEFQKIREEFSDGDILKVLKTCLSDLYNVFEGSYRWTRLRTNRASLKTTHKAVITLKENLK